MLEPNTDTEQDVPNSVSEALLQSISFTDHPFVDFASDTVLSGFFFVPKSVVLK